MFVILSACMLFASIHVSYLEGHVCKKCNYWCTQGVLLIEFSMRQSTTDYQGYPYMEFGEAEYLRVLQGVLIMEWG